ncbi:MAG: hypothetical protein AB7O32_05760 [Vicinamibacterales bacterium]
MSQATVRWTLWHDGRPLTCTEETVPDGFEVHVTYDQLPLAMQYCPRREDVARWSDGIRQRWEATGWSAEPLPEGT